MKKKYLEAFKFCYYYHSPSSPRKKNSKCFNVFRKLDSFMPRNAPLVWEDGVCHSPIILSPYRCFLLRKVAVPARHSQTCSVPIPHQQLPKSCCCLGCRQKGNQLTASRCPPRFLPPFRPANGFE